MAFLSARGTPGEIIGISGNVCVRVAILALLLKSLMAGSSYRSGNGGLQIAHAEYFLMASVNGMGVAAVRDKSGQSAR